MSLNNKTLSLITILLFAGIVPLKSNDAVIQGNAPRVVSEGERFQLTYTVNAQSNTPNLVLPDAFRLLSGPGTSRSTNTSIVNGQVTTSFSLTFTYILDALSEGMYAIEPVTVTVDGKAIKSNKVNIEVVKGNKPAASRSGQGQGQQGQQPANQSGGTSSSSQGDPDFFVRVVVDKKSVYMGEPLVATLKVYTTLNLTSFEKLEQPKFSGFFKEDIPTSAQISLNRENVNGKIYQAGVIAKYLLFPQKTGVIEIDPMTLEAIVSERVKSNDPFDMFFGGNVRRYKVQDVSPKVTINVKPLPEPRPSDFNGGVGQIKLDAVISKTELVTNDAINLKLKFSGSGNIKFLNNPELKFPTDFEVYDPKKDVNVKVSEGGATGVIMWDYLIIPRHAGNFNIPAVTFSYFDLQSQSYKRLTAGPYNINVLQGATDAGTPVFSGTTQQRAVKNIGSDIRFIATGNLKLSPADNYLFGTALYWTGIIFPLGVFGIFFFARKKHEQNLADIARMRNKKAAKLSRIKLKSARKLIKENKEAQVYDEVLRALWQYLANKLIIDTARLNRDRALEMLAEHSVTKETIDKVVELADICEMANYAPAAVKIPASEVYTQAVNLLVQLEREIR
jgi:hypothetical protein